MVEGNPGTTVSDIGKAEDGAISWWGEPGASMERLFPPGMLRQKEAW